MCLRARGEDTLDIERVDATRIRCEDVCDVLFWLFGICKYYFFGSSLSAVRLLALCCAALLVELYLYPSSALASYRSE